MHSENWSSVRRLLLCSSASDNSTEYVTTALELIEEALSDVELQWLTLDLDNHYHLVFELNAVPISNDCLSTVDPHIMINAIKAANFDAAIVLTTPGQSPYHLAYLCYLAGIPIRVGQSKEFGGGVLSHCVHPPLDSLSPNQSILHLLTSVGLHPSPHPRSPDAPNRDVPPKRLYHPSFTPFTLLFSFPTPDP